MSKYKEIKTKKALEIYGLLSLEKILIGAMELVSLLAWMILLLDLKEDKKIRMEN
jgi:hypothetical protein